MRNVGCAVGCIAGRRSCRSSCVSERAIGLCGDQDDRGDDQIQCGVGEYASPTPKADWRVRMSFGTGNIYELRKSRGSPTDFAGRVGWAREQRGKGICPCLRSCASYEHGNTSTAGLRRPFVGGMAARRRECDAAPYPSRRSQLLLRRVLRPPGRPVWRQPSTVTSHGRPLRPLTTLLLSGRYRRIADVRFSLK